MLRNYLAAALRNFRRDRLYAGINIAGLSLAFAICMLVGLFVRSELTFEHFVPDYQEVYRLSVVSHQSFAPQAIEMSPPDIAGWLKLDFPSIQYIARLAPTSHSVRHGEVESNERVFWADPDFFRVLPLPAISGDLQNSLERPDSVVLTRAAARKYFGQTDPLGQLIEIDRKHFMRVTAVLEDLPSNTHLALDIVATARSPYSYLSELDDTSSSGQVKPWLTYTYFRLRPGASDAAIANAMPRFLSVHMPGFGQTSLNPTGIRVQVMPVAAIHLHSFGLGAMKPAGSLTLLYATSIIALLVLVVTSVNFINLITARARQRAVEIAVRKTFGADRFQLIVQFVGESALYTLLSALVGVAIAELALPAFNAFLQVDIPFPYWRDPYFLASLGFAIVLIGVAAGSYPAFLLSALRPVSVFKGGPLGAKTGSRIRYVLVVLQFSILIGVLFATETIWRQTRYAMTESLRLPADQVVLMNAPCKNSALIDQMRAVHGVLDVACSAQLPTLITPTVEATRSDGQRTTLYYNSIGSGFLELYGFRPVAGRFFSIDRPADVMPTDWTHSAPESIVVNETAVRRLGLHAPAQAVGHTIMWTHLLTGAGEFTPIHPARIIGIVPDFQMNSIHGLIEPAAFFLDPSQLTTINVKLRGNDVPEALQAMARIWRKAGPARPFSPLFLDQVIQAKYRDISDQGKLFAALSAVALSVACLGLFGLTIFITGQRTKEIAIRKAMGAGTQHVLGLLVWHFTRPIAWANLIAWPVVAIAMARWLNSFAYHVDLNAMSFLAAGATALAIAWATVFGHALRVARAKPITALHDQ